MSQAARTTVTLLSLCAVLVVAVAWGWHAAMKPLPAKVDVPICVATTVRAGEDVYPQQVTVSVYNAGRRAGLAGRTMQLLVDQGFHKGNLGNAPSAKVSYAQVWTTDTDSPAAQLVADHLGDVDIKHRDGMGAGITIVVGDDFRRLKAKGAKFVTAEDDTEICSPPVS
jgi:hypothetical protein